jgi:hypothetical protein
MSQKLVSFLKNEQSLHAFSYKEMREKTQITKIGNERGASLPTIQK